VATRSLRGTHTAGNGVDFEELTNAALGPVESFHRIIHRDGLVDVHDMTGADVADVLGALLGHARETILRGGEVAR